MIYSRRSLILSVAVIGFVALSACSRSGSSNPDSGRKAASAPAPKSQSELDRSSGKSAQDSNAAPSNNGPDVSNAPDPAPSAAAINAPVGDAGPQVIIYDPTGLKPAQIFASSDAQGPAYLGGQSSQVDGDNTLYFSGSGQDELRKELQSVVDTETRTDRVQRDRDFAKTVSNGRFDVNWSQGSASLDVTVKSEKGETKILRFSGMLDNKLAFRSGDLRHGEKISIEAVCMDLNGGCHTVQAKIQNASGGFVRTAHMIIRQTAATLFTHADGFGYSHNGEFDSLLQTFVRTDQHAGEPDSLNRLQLRTSETINGDASFVVEMGVVSSFNSQQTLNFGGPLVKPLNLTSLSSAVSVMPSTSPAAGTIRNISLIKNDGRGNLTLAVTVRKASEEANEDTMELTFARIHKPLHALSAP